MSQQVVCANRLSDGLVVYLTPDGEWSERIARSGVVSDDEAAEKLLATARQSEAGRIVVDPYFIDVTEIDGEIRPVRYREWIRATGPSVRPDLSKQNYQPADGGQGG
jgi:hypothetical protein